MREIPPTAGLPLHWADFFPAGRSLERGLAEFLEIAPDAPEVQVECSGTAALVVALSTLKHDSARQNVVIPAYTCPLVAIAIVHCGLTPVLCDVRPGHFDFSTEALEQLCNENTLAIIPTHLGGQVADLVPVLAVAQKVGAYVIEDAAQALGARQNGQPIGLRGDIGFFSLAVGKGLSIYEGGVLVARDEALRAKLRATSARIIPKNYYWETRRQLELLGYAAFYRPMGLPYVYGKPLRSAVRRGQLVEAVGDDFDFDIPLHQVSTYRKTIGANALTRLPGFLHRLEFQSEQRKVVLNAIPGVQVVEGAEESRGTWPYFMVMLESQEARDAALRKLWGSGLGVSRLFIHALPDYDYLHHLFPQVGIPNARDFAARMLTISNSPWLEDVAFTEVSIELAGGTPPAQ